MVIIMTSWLWICNSSLKSLEYACSDCSMHKRQENKNTLWYMYEVHDSYNYYHWEMIAYHTHIYVPIYTQHERLLLSYIHHKYCVVFQKRDNNCDWNVIFKLLWRRSIFFGIHSLSLSLSLYICDKTYVIIKIEDVDVYDT